MIYITRNQDTTITTDNIVNYIPDNLSIYLDNTLIGSYLNESNSTLYLRFTIPVSDVQNYQEREYKMKIEVYSVIIKEELVIVKDYTTEPIVEVSKNKEIIFYER